jgi:hypothetical protein
MHGRYHNHCFTPEFEARLKCCYTLNNWHVPLAVIGDYEVIAVAIAPPYQLQKWMVWTLVYLVVSLPSMIAFGDQRLCSPLNEILTLLRISTKPAGLVRNKAVRDGSVSHGHRHASDDLQVRAGTALFLGRAVPHPLSASQLVHRADRALPPRSRIPGWISACREIAGLVDPLPSSLASTARPTILSSIWGPRSSSGASRTLTTSRWKCRHITPRNSCIVFPGSHPARHARHHPKPDPSRRAALSSRRDAMQRNEAWMRCEETSSFSGPDVKSLILEYS